MLFRKLADENTDIDPDDDKRAPFVARAMNAVATYLANGVPEVRLRPDRARALDYYNHAATIFGDSDAQFELAKLYLRPDAPTEEIRRGTHFLSTASQAGHAGAQALFADLLWRGKFMDRDQPRALALIALAHETALPADRIWIDEIAQNIFCGTKGPARQKATGIVAMWKQAFGRGQNQSDQRMGLGGIEGRPQRTCGDGEPVQLQQLVPVDGGRRVPQAAGDGSGSVVPPGK